MIFALQKQPELEVAQEASDLAHKGRAHDAPGDKPDPRARILSRVGHHPVGQGSGKFLVWSRLLVGCRLLSWLCKAIAKLTLWGVVASARAVTRLQ